MRKICSALMVLALCVGGVPAKAQEPARSFPSKPLTIVQPFPPGGASDTLARILAEKVGKSFGQPVIIDSRPGAGGSNAALLVLKAPADGYTIFLSHMGIQSINPFLFDNMPFDPLKDFKTVVSLAEVRGALVVPATSPAREMRDLVRMSKETSRGLSYASSGIGTGSHLLGEIFASRSHANFVHVPYQTSAKALIDLMDGRIDFLFTSLPPILGHIKEGKLRALAVSSSSRIVDHLPDVPTTAEAGFPDVVSTTWYGLFVPAATPDTVAHRINAMFNEALRDPEVSRRLLGAGLWVTGGTAEALDKRIAGERRQYQKIIQEANIKPQ